ncbi:hypothetical protein BEL04_08505 [Mucilaginibacter sp. PPCGB 2223]|nr:hypothetical protein BEL04_08505 [Mucilaginibacter sp. PPCGB 2223]
MGLRWVLTIQYQVGSVWYLARIILFLGFPLKGSNYSLVSNAKGMVSITNLPSSVKFYILGQLALTKYKIIARDSVTLGSQVVQDTLILK